MRLLRSSMSKTLQTKVSRDATTANRHADRCRACSPPSASAHTTVDSTNVARVWSITPSGVSGDARGTDAVDQLPDTGDRCRLAQLDLRAGRRPAVGQPPQRPHTGEVAEPHTAQVEHDGPAGALLHEPQHARLQIGHRR